MRLRSPTWLPLLFIPVAAINCAARSRTASANAPPESMSLAKLVACNDRAVGGDSLRARQSVHYELEITEPTFTATGRYSASRSGTAEINILIGGERVFSEGWDGTSGWQREKGATERTLTSAAGGAALLHGLEQPGHLWTLADMQAHGHQLEAQGQDAVNGLALYVVKLTLRDGFENWYWLDPSTCLVVRNRNFRAFHPDVDATKQWTETRFEDFRTERGITRSYLQHNVQLPAGKVLGTTRVRALTYDARPTSWSASPP